MTQAALTLAAGKPSACRIVIDDHAAAPVRSAADELRDVLRQAADVTLAIAPASTAATDCEIILGPSARARQLAPDVDVAALGPEGYVIRTVGKRLLILGGEPRGTLYGVYAFCQKYLGCRWFAKDITHVPRQGAVRLGPVDERYIPPLQYRNYILNGTDDPHWCARNFYNGFNSAATLELGGRVTHWHYGHSLHDLLRVEEHFAEHPEYFDSVSRGKRVLDDPVQPCCTNDDAARIITDNLRRVIERDLRTEQADPTQPAPQVYYLAQHDGGSYCMCPSCRRLIDAEGSPSAPLIHLCNKVVEVIDRAFPDRSLLTIAYRFSRRPPRTLRAHPKLIVQLCSIECCQSHAHAVCDSEDAVLFREDMEGWQRAAERIWVWDYVANLWHPFLTGPGVDVVPDNIRYFVEHGVSGIFVQDGGERDFRGLRAYLMSQALWDPALDAQAATRGYMSHVYGPAAEPMLRFMSMIREQVNRENIHVHYKANALQPYCTGDTARRADALWDEAQHAVRDDAQRTARVREQRMHFLCSTLQHESQQTVLTRCRVIGDRYAFDRPAAMQQRVDEFAAWYADRFGTTVADAARSEISLDREVVTLDNGLVELDFLPRLAGRMIAMRLKRVAHNFLHMTDPVDGAWNLADGYFETWLGARQPYRDRHEAVCSWRTKPGRGRRGAAESGAFAHDLGEHLLFEIGGMFVHPMQWERWTRLSATEPRLLIESQRVNRGIHDENGAIATNLPLNLGDIRHIMLRTPGPDQSDATDVRLDESGDELTFTPQEMEAGLTLINREQRLALRVTPRGERVARGVLRADHATGRIMLRIECESTMLAPGGGLRLFQMIELLHGDAV